MRSSAGKRKIFDAVDLLNEDDLVVKNNGVVQVNISEVKPFRNHPFRLYEGERLNEMVESIKIHGILSLVIVLETNDGYEMLAGHNRLKAAKIAGLSEIPAIIKTDLSEEEAYVYVIETNVLQRSFSELLPSEKAAVLALRYEKVICQGRRNDILNDIANISGVEPSKETCGHDVHKSRTREDIGEDYGMTGRNMARYLRINELNQTCKDLMDAGNLPLVCGVEVSYLSKEEQEMVAKEIVASGCKLKQPAAEVLHKNAGNLDRDKISQIVTGSGKSKSNESRMFASIRKEYFKGMNTDEIQSILIKALDAWFSSAGENDNV